MDLKEVKDSLEALRTSWEAQAYGIERVFGTAPLFNEAPAARGFRACSADLYPLVDALEKELMQKRAVDAQ